MSKTQNLWEIGSPEESRNPEFRRADLRGKLDDFKAEAGSKELADVLISADWAELAGLEAEARLARAEIDLATAEWGPPEERREVFGQMVAARADELFQRFRETGSLWRGGSPHKATGASAPVASLVEAVK